MVSMQSTRAKGNILSDAYQEGQSWQSSATKTLLVSLITHRHAQKTLLEEHLGSAFCSNAFNVILNIMYTLSMWLSCLSSNLVMTNSNRMKYSPPERHCTIFRRLTQNDEK